MESSVGQQYVKDSRKHEAEKSGLLGEQFNVKKQQRNRKDRTSVAFSFWLETLGMKEAPPWQLLLKS